MKPIAFAASPAPAAVLVTGLRQSIQTSQEIDQNADVFVDAISTVSTIEGGIAGTVNQQTWERGSARLNGPTHRVHRGQS